MKPVRMTPSKPMFNRSGTGIHPDEKKRDLEKNAFIRAEIKKMEEEDKNFDASALEQREKEETEYVREFKDSIKSSPQRLKEAREWFHSYASSSR